MHKLQGVSINQPTGSPAAGELWVGVPQGPAGTHPGEAKRIKYTLNKRVN